MTECVAAKGHAKVAFARGRTKRDTRGLERLVGYPSGMLESGSKYDRQGPDRCTIWRRRAAEARRHVACAQAVPRVTVAFGILVSCQRLGIAVPDDL